MQTVRKLAICAKKVDQSADFRVRPYVERPDAWKFAAKIQASAKPSDFSHSLHDFCT